MGKCHFHAIWLQKEQNKNWLPTDLRILIVLGVAFAIGLLLLQLWENMHLEVTVPVQNI